MKRVALILLVVVLEACSRVVEHRAPAFKYPPPDWQTAICLPDDWQKTLVNKSGSLLYDFQGGASGFGIRVSAGSVEPAEWKGQQLLTPRVPVVVTRRQAGAIRITEQAFARTPLSWDGRTSTPLLRQDILLVRLENPGSAAATITPTVSLESVKGFLTTETATGAIEVNALTRVEISRACAVTSSSRWKRVLQLEPLSLAPNSAESFSVLVTRARSAGILPASEKNNSNDAGKMPALLHAAERFWTTVNLPYGRIQVPDPDIQALLDSAVRNIYQARELKGGLPAFQVGPTCYRGLWVVDGSFIMEAVSYLGRLDEARRGIEYLLGFQKPDGGFSIIKGHWKETGIVLWAVTRHARLTGDRVWLEAQWPRLQRAVGAIQAMRREASADPQSLSAGLLPAGFSDGGLKGPNDEYTNVYWTLAGLRAAAETARWLGRGEDARAWQGEFEDMLAAFRRAAARDLRTDGKGPGYLPILMNGPAGVPRQKAQWAFLHAVFPGRVFAADDPLVTGNMAMLRECEEEGLVLDTGWADKGLWTYFGSFYAHALLWEGEGAKAARTLYAFANHASPLLAWREEQMPQGRGIKVIGDMPHNWASAEMIRLARHLLALERGGELHLLEGMPREWAKPGAVTRLKGVQTEFGPIDLEVRVAGNGRAARVRLAGDWRTPPTRIMLHLGQWCGSAGGALELPVKKSIEHRVGLIRHENK